MFLRRASKRKRGGVFGGTNIIGTCVSGFFLFLIAALNVIVLAGDHQGIPRDALRRLRRPAGFEEQLNKRGLMNRFLGPLARRVDTPWKMYPIGFLFGLGFDTATEVALLVLAGTAVVGGLAVLRDLVAADPVRGRDEPVRYRLTVAS